jgi:small redox-active disulfide protein 2
MKVQILGTGCPKCSKLADNAQAAVNELGAEVEIVKVTNINDIVSFGVMATPALGIDGEVKAAGRVPGVDEIKEWIQRASI